MKNIAIGVIGAGLIGRKHLRKLAERTDYDLVGIADLNIDQVTAEHPKARVFADYRLRVADVLRDYGMNVRTEAPADSRRAHAVAAAV